MPQLFQGGREDGGLAWSTETLSEEGGPSEPAGCQWSSVRRWCGPQEGVEGESRGRAVEASRTLVETLDQGDNKGPGEGRESREGP